MQLFTFWSFAPITYIERLCLTSMLAAGHPVAVYSYDYDLDLPEGIELRDASEVMPRQAIRPSLFADLFRYEGLHRGLGTWVDADILLLRSLADMGDHIFGWEVADSINNAVLCLPSDSPFFRYVAELANAHVPMHPNWGWRRRFKQRLRASVGKQKLIDEIGWTVLGPAALTQFASRNGLSDHAQSPDVFYPVPYLKALDTFDPRVTIEDSFTANTRAVHLWNTKLTQHKALAPPDNSFIGRMCRKYAVALP